MSKIQLTGRIFLTFNIKTKSGLHIGGSDEGISIGGVDKTVIRDSLTNQPYIPGSSLRGKIRSLTEKYTGADQNKRIGVSTIHTCTDKDAYQQCDICQIYGVPGEAGFSQPTRLIARDVQMSDASAEELRNLRTDLPFTEMKTEVAIDRVTSAASPRQMERVPAGVVFGRAEMVYSLYSGSGCDSATDLKRFKTVITGLQLLEDDYLGGLGSRGSGKVELASIEVKVKSKEKYDTSTPCHPNGGYANLQALVNDYSALNGKVANALSIANGE
ncbi:MAG TPA: type III-A CRISPR-associated RAMP protein Csm3 [Chloroflexi bacterium]|nr:type III-A CRISPR-associated RAMP protein Csm3 [Chloroflexota bacterium]